MTEYLSQCDIPVEIYKYDPNAPDGLFEKLKYKFESMTYDDIKKATGLRRDKYQLLVLHLNNSEVKSMISLTNLSGLGLGTVQKCFSLITDGSRGEQLSFFRD
jgi:hypothetical protein